MGELGKGCGREHKPQQKNDLQERSTKRCGMKDSFCAFLCSMGNCRIAKVILGAREGKKQMKVLIVSDTHGHRKEIREIIEREKPIDLLIHLGDIQGDEEYIQSLAACPMERVKGNSDRDTAIPRDQEILLDHHKIFLTHGHCYGVNTTLDRVAREGLRRNADIVMFGHTHIPLLLEERMLTILNPGSTSDPRQKNGRPSYMVMEWEKGKRAEFTLRYL